MLTTAVSTVGQMNQEVGPQTVTFTTGSLGNNVPVHLPFSLPKYVCLTWEFV